MSYGIATINKGLEDACIDNISEITGIAPSGMTVIEGIPQSAVMFKASPLQLCELSYMCQAASRILFYLGKAEKLDIDIIEKEDTEIAGLSLDFSGLVALLKENMTFRVSCISPGSDVSSAEAALGGIIMDGLAKHGITLKVDLKNPELTFYGIMIDGALYMGLDFSGDLSKRDYRVFNSSMSLKGTTAFGLLKLAGYTPKDFLLDPFCNSGTLCIEAALYASRTSPRLYDKDFPFTKLKITGDYEPFFKKIDARRGEAARITCADPLLRNLAAAKKNAKIAGVEKLIEFRRIDTDWLDGKFEERTVDRIVTFIPGSSKNRDERALAKSYKEIFYQAEYILKDSGTVTILCISKELLMEQAAAYFKLESVRDIYSGEQLMHILTFKKKIDGGE